MGFKLCLGLSLTSIVYLLIGGAIFEALERPHERLIETALENAYQDFLANNSCVSDQDLLELSTYLLEVSDAGVRSSNITMATGNNWDFDNAVFFCFTVISTIGYGNVSPSTTGGQVMFIFYAMFGIPLMLSALAHYGVWISQANKMLADKMRFYDNRDYDKVFDGALLYLLGWIVCVLVPGVLFNLIEDWTYMEAVYYAVTTISTVGFGDYVPKPVPGDGFVHFIYTFGVCIWCVLGLTWFAGLISTLQGRLDSNIDHSTQSAEKNKVLSNSSG